MNKTSKIATKICGVGIGLMLLMPVSFAATPSIQNVTASPNPYDPANGFMDVGYSLSNSTGATTVNAGIYNQTNLDTPLITWTFTNQSNGNKTWSWDGKNSTGSTAAEGDYVFTVGGNDGGNTLHTQQATFTISHTPPPAACAGFSDISAVNQDCPAVTYVKSIGAMTGTSPNIFAPQNSLQRDQIIKIVLQTFKKFKTQTDYCQGKSPFLDITSKDWSYQYICQAKIIGVTTGYTAGPDKGYFRPVRTVSRIEFLALVLRNITEAMPAISSTSYADVAAGQWFSGYARYAYDHGLFNKPNLFPTTFMTRIEVARVIFKLHQQGKV